MCHDEATNAELFPVGERCTWVRSEPPSGQKYRYKVVVVRNSGKRILVRATIDGHEVERWVKPSSLLPPVPPGWHRLSLEDMARLVNRTRERVRQIQRYGKWPEPKRVPGDAYNQLLYSDADLEAMRSIIANGIPYTQDELGTGYFGLVYNHDYSSWSIVAESSTRAEAKAQLDRWLESEAEYRSLRVGSETAVRSSVVSAHAMPRRFGRKLGQILAEWRYPSEEEMFFREVQRLLLELESGGALGGDEVSGVTPPHLETDFFSEDVS